MHSFYTQFTDFKATEKHYGTSYYWATKLFPRDIRHATYVLYTWVRVPDEIVDNSPQEKIEETRTLLLDYVTKWKEAYEKQMSDIPVLDAAAKVFHKYNIPYDVSAKFLQAMISDLHTKRYETYLDLEDYMAGSAAAVGIMMSYILGFKDGALPYARMLGDAMQMTNFLRDVQEDIDERDRIYLPQEDMRLFNITDEHVINHNSDALRPLIRDQVEKVRAQYVESMKGIPMLRRGKLPVAYAAFLYSALLSKLEEQDYDVFAGRVYTTKRDKLALLWKTLRFMMRKDPAMLLSSDQG